VLPHWDGCEAAVAQGAFYTKGWIMRNFLKCALAMACLAWSLPGAQAFHHQYVTGPVQITSGVPVQAFRTQSFGSQRFTVQSLPAFQVQSAQSYQWVPVNAQSAEAQGVGSDLAIQLLRQFIQGGIGNLNPGGGTASSSDTVRELQANTAALTANTAALNKLTSALQGSNTTNGTTPAKKLTTVQVPPGVAFSAQDLQPGADQGPAAAPKTTEDYLDEAEAQIDLMNRSAVAAKRYLDYIDSKTQAQTTHLKTLRGQLDKLAK
jgi:hypothetical protein